ncbi:hypothetical protein GL263_20350 [Streptomyces durbertensis]|uniref:Roadblock/LAMTOR2 domain-containing protein n=1 Tax=Streptomyces durbertensis TaxID=2448886 RepID=A0ABR6EKM0_9ACTN|nr:hypothetical protein [Streptomyces durbertensis]MBB1245883.1 hypothetical protein [Streptomyces durbertensis]
MPGIDECLLEAMVLPGARGAAVVDWTSGLALGTVGESPAGDHEASAAETAELARMAAEQPSFGEGGPDDGPGVEDVIVSARNGFHLLRFVETGIDSTVFLYLWLDPEEGNLALARLRLRALAERLVLT